MLAFSELLPVGPGVYRLPLDLRLPVDAHLGGCGEEALARRGVGRAGPRLSLR